MKKPNYPKVSAAVIDEDTMRYGGSFFKRERTCNIIIEDECPVCSECNEDIDPSWVACPYCGARVERDA